MGLGVEMIEWCNWNFFFDFPFRGGSGQERSLSCPVGKRDIIIPVWARRIAHPIFVTSHNGSYMPGCMVARGVLGKRPAGFDIP